MWPHRLQSGLGVFWLGFVFFFPLSLCCVPEEQKSAFFQQEENCSVSKLPPACLLQDAAGHGAQRNDNAFTKTRVLAGNF